MKKNKMMRAASGMLVATLVSTCAFSGAMAKYVVSDGVTDTARVAKFGVVVTAAGDLFGKSYGGSDAVATANTIQAWGLNKVNVSSAGADATAAALLVAPGTKNDKGMTFTVKGTPEVSTKLTIDVPETGNAASFNTDIKLLKNSYAIMVKVNPATVVITDDNKGNFYQLASGAFTPLASAEGVTGDVYKMVQLTGVNAGSTMADTGYLPIKWTVTDKAGTATAATDVAGVLAALKTQLSGVATGEAAHTPNQAWDATSTVTWEWPFTTLNDSGDELATGAGAWTGVDSDTTLPNWENTTLEDLEDTILGQMINNALVTGDTPTYDYEVAVVAGTAESPTVTQVKYANVDAKAGSANKVYVAYTGNSAPTAAFAGTAGSETLDSSIVACLTATFGARTTVEQTNMAQPTTGDDTNP